LTLITTPVPAVGCPRFALAATAGDEAAERRRIQVMRDWETPLCLDDGMEVRGNGGVMRRLDTLLKPRALETSTRGPTTAHDETLGVCRRGISATLAWSRSPPLFRFSSLRLGPPPAWQR
jgi:hypothetical protein